jgi:hypothetical protein
LLSEQKVILQKEMVRRSSNSQDTGRNRDMRDKFYTRKEVVEVCCKAIKKTIDIHFSNDLIIEPSAGNGAFINCIKKMCDNYLFIDIEPRNRSVRKFNYLDFEMPPDIDFRKIHVIGNPPFGRMSSMAIKFIKISCEFCDTLSFILPKGFKKELAKRHFPPQFHLVYQIDLPNDSFVLNGEYYKVPCVFQIWVKKDTKRKTHKKLYPMGFDFCSKSNRPNIAIRRTGKGAGDIFIETRNKNPGTHHFIKFTNGKSLKNNLQKVSKAIYQKNNTLAAESVSKQEIIRQFNRLLSK